MNLSAPFIRRPVATTLMAAAVLLVGIVAFFILPVSALPNVDFPTLQVSASLPGASPETMASNVATPLERQFSLIPGISQMTSASSLGSTNVTIQFQLGQSLTSEFQQVQAAINAASAQLPTNLPAQPTIRQVNPADAPIMILALTSDTLPLDQVDNYADVIFSQQISSINGVGLVNIGGQQKPAVRIQLDPRKVAARGLQMDAVRAKITSATTNAPKGAITGANQNLTVYANDQILDATPWNDIVVGYSNGAPVQLRDVGTISQSVENNQVGAFVFPGKANTDRSLPAGQAIMLVIFKAPGANVITTVDDIRKQLPKLEANIPPGIKVHVLMDRTQTIRAAVKDVETTLVITVALVVIVIYLFLLNVRATLIPSAIIPLALLGAAAFMLPAKYSLDNLSLMALSIAVGFVVDDAIVMVEVIWQHLEKGEGPLEAAMKGSAEVSFTILSISISLVAVFTPLMFMGGVVGLLMREFAVTLSAAVVISMVLTLTVTPMFCSQFLKRPKESENPVIRGLEHGFRWLEARYSRALDGVLEHKLLTLLVFAGTMALAGYFYATAKTGFFPQQDTGFLTGVMLTSQDSSFTKAKDKIQAVGSTVAADPAVTGVGMFVGNGGVNQANLFIALQPKTSGRTVNADQIIARLRPKLADLIGVQAFLQAAQDINIGGRAGQAQYQYTLSDSNLAELNAWAPRMLAQLKTLPVLKDVSSDQQSNGRAVNLTIDRQAAARFGLAPTDVDTAIYELIGQAEVTQYFTQQNSYHVVVEGPPDLQATPDLFNTVYVLSPTTGKTVPLSQFVKVDPLGTNSLTVNHQSEFPSATLSFNLSPGASLSQATQAIAAARDKLGAPATLNGAFQGTAQAFQQSLSSEPILILAALIAVYVILGVLYESFVHPLTILSTLPSAGLGALLALKLAGQDLNVIGIIAIILLIGIVKKNGIMIVDVALRLERDRDLTAEEAAREASRQRFRPILMTTACAALSGVPMILMKGTGSEFRQPLGYAIVGGLLVSQVLTLFTTPVIYIYLDKLRNWRRTPDRKTTEPEAQSGSPGGPEPEAGRP
ncbi:MAG TPA: efflux RND transporter permease subunit [Phenylobacterium sp.]|uniref:efflux RND transporter permease subunit n=1 Tax=Phenylobacterium sp. TaxID=1871053 RepID=UPI002CB1C55C|nr:efflux RND transporter permease subunit [Phenylobacterium sp.]HXA39361.1 efflux RND transporter permease subunit [Phenylobacterium sp.]